MKYALLLIFLLTSFTAQAMQTRMMSIKRADGSYACLLYTSPSPRD